MTRPAPTVTVPVDTFNGDNAALVASISALLETPDTSLSARVPGMAKQLLASAAARLTAAPAAPQAAGVGEEYTEGARLPDGAISGTDDGQTVWLESSTGGAHRLGVWGGLSLRFEEADGSFTVRDYEDVKLRAPSREPEGGAVDGWRTIDSAPIGELVQVYWPCMALDDDGEPTGETLDREGHVSLSVRHSEQHGWEPDNVVEANGDWFGDDFEFGQPTHWRPRPSRPAAAIATREEAPAEAGDARPLCVIAFREGKREPELISSDRMPVGEYKLYGDAQNLGFLIDTDDGTEWAEEDPRMSGIPEYFENVRPLTLETAKEEMLSAWEIRSELEAALRAPSREPEGGAVDDGAFKIATDLHKAYEQLIYGLPKYLDAENLTDEENMIREAWVTLDVTAHRLAALATREEAPAEAGEPK